MAWRTALRAEKLAVRQALRAAEHAVLSARLEAHLRAWLAARAPACLAFCAPVNGEFDARPLAAELLAQAWAAAMPVVIAPARPMIFRAWTPSTPMTADRYGIPIPVEGDEVLPDIVLLPLVAFDAAGFRLGYGGGYFDRTLAALAPRPLAVGVGFELARTASIHPQPHDLPLDAIITEAGAVFGAASPSHTRRTLER
ncbi:MAG: 5-formyltetrahydrofolate cyclo-ligase [Betaproteobacteria bacterium HGW-Betaproteobacteria-11]|nr:MAG: 5-formyltetrahydrofolate cyclo-ligase [Betaproteobacteria bacterium HGW-Betaproteobacteria-11]